MPDKDAVLKPLLYKSFNRDCVVAAALESSFTVTSMFSPMLAHRGVEPEYAGTEALSVLVPNLGAAPWETVVEFREHRGSVEARAQLREFERLAAEQEPRDAYDFLKKVSQEVNRAYRAAVEELAPSLPEAMAKELLLTAISLTSVIGPVIEKLVALTETAAEAWTFNRSWIAALMKLFNN
jgi:hypothetical protein